jgi:NAD+ kinase
MARAILFVNLKKENAQTLADEIRKEIGCQGMGVDMFTFEGKGEPSIAGSGYDVAFSLGGDGTVLYTARAVAAQGLPIFPVNLGTVGFIAAVHPEEWKTVFDAWRAGKARVSRRLMLEVRVEREGAECFRSSCLNDIVISASGIAKLIRLEASICYEESAEALDARTLLPLGEYRADGLIIATPTGSTAYSVAAGGPIVDSEMQAIILNPICPFALSHRPIVLPAWETLLVDVGEKQRSSVLLTVDGQVTEPLKGGDRLLITAAPSPANLIASDRRIFYDALRTKLAWNNAAMKGSLHA